MKPAKLEYKYDVVLPQSESNDVLEMVRLDLERRIHELSEYTFTNIQVTLMRDETGRGNILQLPTEDELKKILSRLEKHNWSENHGIMWSGDAALDRSPHQAVLRHTAHFHGATDWHQRERVEKLDGKMVTTGEVRLTALLQGTSRHEFGGLRQRIEKVFQEVANHFKVLLAAESLPHEKKRAEDPPEACSPAEMHKE